MSSMASGQYVLVAVNVGVRKEFTYRVPEQLSSILRPGTRVALRFHGKRAVGFVLDFCNAQPGVDPGRILDVEDVLDPEPLLDQKMLSLLRWASEYYLAPCSELLRAALPRGLYGAPRRYVKSVAGGQRADAKDAVPGWAQAFLEKIPGNRPVSVSWLRRVLGAQFSSYRLLMLEQLGMVEIMETQGRRLKEPLQQKAHPVRVVDESLAQGAQQPAELSVEQAAAGQRIAAAIQERKFKTFLLQGVTGSGKTEVYISAVKEALAQGRSALALVPEIALTPRIAALFSSRFGSEVAVLHSGLTDAEHGCEWRRIKGGEARIVVGARSAVFAPLENLGLIVVDEEHDHSYKQDNAPRYNARDVALMRGKLCSATVLLGSATPALESYHNALTGKYELIEMPSRIAERPLPAVEFVNLAEYSRKGAQVQALSERLREAILACLAAGEQAIVFINRRGFSSLVLCSACRQPLRCRNCDIALTYHSSRKAVACHYCGHEAPLPGRCSRCGRESFTLLGRGTERVEAECADLLAQAGLARDAILRLDRDSVSCRAELERILRDFISGRARILVGTQMVAKGHDFPNVTLVGIAMADLGLWMPDFRAAERMFSLLTQVSGRAGRGEKPGRVIIQTFQPEHPVFRFLRDGAQQPFYSGELSRRKEAGYPPFSRLAAVHFSGNVEQRVERAASRFLGELCAARERIYPRAGIEILGPAPPPIGRMRGKWRLRILIKAARSAMSRALIEQALGRSGGRAAVAMGIDVDPVNMM